MFNKIICFAIVVLMIVNFTACTNKPEDLVDNPNTEVEKLEKVEKAYSETTKLALEKLSKTGKFAAESAPEVLDGKENNVYSPISFYLALAMLSELDKNDQEILGALQGKNVEEIEEYIKENLEGEIFEEEEARLHLANSIWLSNEDDIIEEVFNSLTDYHSAEVRSVNFKKSDKVISEMKKWISKNTMGLIDKASPNITKETKMVILNAIYLKNIFLDPFFEKKVATNFTDLEGEVHPIKMLSDYSGNLDYYETDGGQVVIKPLEDGMNAVFIRPKDGLSKIISTESIAEILVGYKFGDLEKKANIEIPSMDLTSKLNLEKAAKRIGIQKVFDPYQSRLQAYKNLKNLLYLSLIQQEAAFKMDKNGIEAASYTELVIDESGILLEDEPVEVIFDVPFMFMILSKNSEPLFIGTYTSP